MCTRKGKASARRLFCSQDCFLPSLKWVVGAFQHLSITDRDEDEEEEKEEEEGCFILPPSDETGRSRGGISTETITQHNAV